MMKMKRILLVVTIGVSFAPPVFAAPELASYRSQAARTGELESDRIDYRGTQCASADARKGDLGADNGSVEKSTAGAAR